MTKRILSAALLLVSGAAFAGVAASDQPPNDPNPSGIRPMPKSGGFDELDTSRDGYLDRHELAVDTARARHFEKFDTNGDGKISKEEWMENQTASRRDDKDRDEH